MSITPTPPSRASNVPANRRSVFPINRGRTCLRELGISLSLSVEYRTIYSNRKALQKTFGYLQFSGAVPSTAPFPPFLQRPPYTPFPSTPPTHPNSPKLLPPTPLPSSPQPHSSFSFPAAFLLSARSSSIRPVTGRWRTASGPQTVSNPLWKPHSTACSTGLSKIKGRNGTAARPSCDHQSAIASATPYQTPSNNTGNDPRARIGKQKETYPNRPPRSDRRVLRIPQRLPTIPHNTMDRKRRQAHTRHTLKHRPLRHHSPIILNHRDLLRLPCQPLAHRLLPHHHIILPPRIRAPGTHHPGRIRVPCSLVV